MRLQVALAVVLYAEVAALRHFLLAHLHVDPFGCALGRDVVALHDALYAHWAWRCDADYMVERYAAVESTLEEYGAFEPLLAGSGEVVCHCGVYDVVYGELVRLACEKKLSKHRLLKHSVGRVDSVAYKRLELLLQPVGGAHESLCSSIAVVHLDAALLQESADIALARAYSASYCYLHCCLLFLNKVVYLRHLQTGVAHALRTLAQMYVALVGRMLDKLVVVDHYGELV